MKYLNLKIILLGQLVFCILSCNQKDSYAQIQTEKLIKVNIDELQEGVIPLSKYFDKISYIPLEETNLSLLYNISQLEVYKNQIYVLDVSQNTGILVFTMKGKFIKKIGKKGKGPGEFIRLGSFSIEPKTGNVYALDLSTQKLIIYKPSGAFINEIQLPTQKTRSSYICVSDEPYIYTNMNMGRQQRPLPHIIQVLSKKKKTSSFLLNPGTHNKGWTKPYHIAGNGGGFYKTPNGIRFTSQFMDTLFTINGNNVSPFLVVESKYKPSKKEVNAIPQKNKSKILNRKAQLMQQSQSSSIREIHHFFENNHFFTFAFKQKNKRHHILYNKKNEKFTLCKFDDDLTFDDKNTYYTSPNIYYGNNEIAVAVINKEILQMTFTQSGINKSMINTFEKKHNLNDNPIIVLYHLRD